MPRGKKTCPECNAQVGPRLAVCECGFEFTFKHGKSPKRSKAPKAIPVEKPFEALTENPVEVVGVKDRSELADFINQLQTCFKDSDRQGGCYSAFLHHQTGTLQVEVWFEMRLKHDL